MQLNGNCIYALSHYLIHRTALAPSRLNSEQIRQLDAFLAQKYPLLYSFCLQILETLGQKLDLEPRRIDMLLLALWLHKQGANNQKQVTHAVILAHGYATASSIANVANRLLKNTIFESFDMPLDVTPEAIAQQVMRYLEEHPLASGLMILVDMGSLKAIHRHFDRALSTPVTIINNVSTSMALYVGERILQGHFIEEIARDIARDVPVEYQLYWPKSNKPRAILTTCATGIGVATNLCALLSASIPQALEIDVVACDYAMLASNKTRGAGIYALRRTGDSRHAGPAHRQRAVDFARLADLRRGESLSDAAVWFADHAGAGGGDQQPAAEKLLAPTSDRIRHHPRHQQSHQPR